MVSREGGSPPSPVSVGATQHSGAKSQWQRFAALTWQGPEFVWRAAHWDDANVYQFHSETDGQTKTWGLFLGLSPNDPSADWRAL